MATCRQSFDVHYTAEDAEEDEIGRQQNATDLEGSNTTSIPMCTNLVSVKHLLLLLCSYLLCYAV